jgi:hypothetical protein
MAQFIFVSGIKEVGFIDYLWVCYTYDMSYESFTSLENEPPVGIGGEKLKEERETLPMVDVRNSVEWVDKDVESPFNLEVGKKADFPLFLSANPSKKEETYPLEVE